MSRSIWMVTCADARATDPFGMPLEVFAWMPPRPRLVSPSVRVARPVGSVPSETLVLWNATLPTEVVLVATKKRRRSSRMATAAATEAMVPRPTRCAALPPRIRWQVIYRLFPPRARADHCGLAGPTQSNVSRRSQNAARVLGTRCDGPIGATGRDVVQTVYFGGIARFAVHLRRAGRMQDCGW